MTLEYCLSDFLNKTLELDPVLSVSTLAVFLYVATHENCTAANIVRDLGLAQPAVVRHLQRLTFGSPQSLSVGRGLELLEFSEDPADARRRLYKLSMRGQKTLAGLLSSFT
nr:helix-turn-helix domain-containing protein [uncultured Pseudogulbenkiania sp.]